MKTSPFLSDDPEIRRAEKVYERPGWLAGYKTWIGIALAIAGMIGKHWNIKIPGDEINAWLELVNQNWAGFAEVFGALITIWGRFAIGRDHKEAVAVVAVVTEKLAEAKVVVAEVKKDLVVTEIELIKTKDKLAEAKQQ